MNPASLLAQLSPFFFLDEVREPCEGDTNRETWEPACRNANASLLQPDDVLGVTKPFFLYLQELIIRRQTFTLIPYVVILGY